MKIELVQMNVVAGRPDLNVANMLGYIEKAKKKGIDIIVFPEMCIGGYLLGDKWTDETFCNNLMAYNDILKKASNNIGIVYGNIFVEDYHEDNITWHPNKDGRRRKYNAAYFFYNRRPVRRNCNNPAFEGLQPKTLLPTYRIFDDERYFLSLFDEILDENTYSCCMHLNTSYAPFIFERKNETLLIGLECCEDLWCKDYRLGNKSLNPTKMLIHDGANIIINISASPWTYQKNEARNRRIKEVKDDIEFRNSEFVPFLYCNFVGVQNNGKNIVTFDGETTIYDKNGEVVSQAAKQFEEQTLIFNTKSKYKKHEVTYPSKIEQKYNAIITGIKGLKDILGIQNHPKFVIGLSGGVDSAVVASLLVKAVGADKVMAVNMPTQYNSDKTKNIAEKIAKELKIPYFVVPIEGIFNHVKKVMSNSAIIDPSPMNEENEQARIRGSIILAGIAAREGALFTCNGNKLEVALGYSTLYGDVNGAIAPIGDLTKVEVWEMAEYINKIFKKEIISRDLIPNKLCQFKKDQVAPSAELKNDQIDPMKFGYHDALLEAVMNYKKVSPEDVIKWYINKELHTKLNIPLAMIKRWGIDNPEIFVKDLEWFFSNFQKNVFKRIQSPPIIITSKTAFGYDLRESQMPFFKSNEYKKLEKQILKNSNDTKFTEHLKSASKIVKKWPKWKRNLLG